MAESAAVDIERAFASRLEDLEVRDLSESFEAKDCLLLVENFVPTSILTELTDALSSLRPAIHRNFVPGQKKGGAISRAQLDRLAPQFGSVYACPPLWRFVERLTGETLEPCRPADPHTYALYFYSEPGDHIGWHYDTSFYRGRRFTMLFCLAGNDSVQLECDLYRRDDSRPTERQTFALEPGTMVLFDGDRLWHRATPMAVGDRERVLLTMEFVTDASISPVKQLVSNVKDAWAYFGFKEVFMGAG